MAESIVNVRMGEMKSRSLTPKKKSRRTVPGNTSGRAITLAA